MWQKRVMPSMCAGAVNLLFLNGMNIYCKHKYEKETNFKIAIFASDSNYTKDPTALMLQRLIAATKQTNEQNRSELNATIKFVLSDTVNTRAAICAKRNNIPTVLVNYKHSDGIHKTTKEYFSDITPILKTTPVDLILFMNFNISLDKHQEWDVQWGDRTYKTNNLKDEQLITELQKVIEQQKKKDFLEQQDATFEQVNLICNPW